VIDQESDRVAKFAEIVGRDVSRHTDGDAGRAIQQQRRETGREHGRLAHRVIVIGLVIDGILLDVAQQFLGDRRHARFGVAHRRRGVAIHGAEVTLTIDQRVPQRPGLRHARQGVVDCGVAVGVEILQHLPDDTGALAVPVAVAQAHLVHRVEDASLHRLHAVAHVRQSALHDDAHRVVEIRCPHLVVDINQPNRSDFHALTCLLG
jgi:hypothetical protein